LVEVDGSKDNIDNKDDDNEDTLADGDDTDEDDTEEGIDLGYCIPPCKYEQEDIHDLDLEVSDLQATRQRTNVDIDSSAQWF